MKKRSILVVVLTVFMLFGCVPIDKENGMTVRAEASSLYTPTVKNMLANAFLPVGKAVYVYGGAWNEEDTAAGVEAMTYGISSRWAEFYNAQSSAYNYQNTRYQIHDGLDCTGYVGWTMYQLFGNSYSDIGYVYQSKKMASSYASLFGGTYTPKEQVTKRVCGDVMSSGGHAYMVVGQCSDGSVVFLHASPPAVNLCGTAAPNGRTNSEAVKLATRYMKTYFPAHYGKFPDTSRGKAYLTDYNRMQWPENVLPDPDGYRNMSAEAILADLFENVKIYANGARLFSDAEPYIDEGTTYVPLRAVSESFGAEVIWSEETGTATVQCGGHTVMINVRRNTVAFDDDPDSRMFQMKNDRITVPIRLAAELCGFQVEWEGVSKSVYLTK
ncbi:MAG: copper amine oxidase N-terminal domain-containing protein [Clostridia bacterium]|nr:copper amine oxidase N-terminal domain-containing protein [Clostridia bacterium]